MKIRSRRKQYLNKWVYTAVMTVLLAGCGGSGGGGTNTDDIPPIGGVTTQTISGGGVKGPLTSANVAVYGLSFGASVIVDTTAIDTGTTDSQAKIQNLALPFPLAPPYILEFKATADTMDLATCSDPTDSTTCFAPILSTMRTVITAEMLASGQHIYATPLTTMAVNIALQNARDADTSGTAGFGTVEADEFLAAVKIAGNQIASTMGFGMGGSVNIFNTPPLLDDSSDTMEEQADTASYRAAVEALGAIVSQMDGQAAGNSDDVINELANDLADGVIDGQVDGAPSAIFTDTTLDVLQQDPSNLPIPNTDDGTGSPILVGHIAAELAAEAADTGATVNTTALTDGTSIVVNTAPAETNPDIDADGVLNVDDAFPKDIAASVDSDGDGMPDDWHSGETTTTGLVLDDDDDNDGVADASDAFPLDPSENANTDAAHPTNSDLIGNNADTDDDGDGVLDINDDFPLDSTKSSITDLDNDGWDVDADPNDSDDTNPGIAFVDTDNDGLADDGGLIPDDDDDNDGVADGNDAFPLVASEWVDTDGDTTGNNADTDDDNDTVLDVDDDFPLNASEDTDTDHDGIGNNADTDDDGDSLSDATEGSVDTDGDGIPDSLDIDSDNDGYLDGVDLAPLDANVTVNTAPLATSQSETVAEDGSVVITLSVTDPDAGDTAGVMIYTVGTASNGTATNNADGTVSYSPDADFNGSDSFTYSVTDTGGAKSNTATVTITVTAQNDAPVITEGTTTTVNMDEDGSPTAFNLTLNATDVESDTINWSISGAATNGTASATGTGTSKVISYVPTANWSGSDSFDVQISDGTDTNTITVTVNVAAVNDSPVITEGAAATVYMDEDGSPTPFSLTLNATDTEGSAMTWSISGTASNGTATASGTGTSKVIGYTPTANWSGSDSFDVQVFDGTDIDTITVTVNVAVMNDAPIITEGATATVDMDEDGSPTPFSLILNATDTEGSAMTWSISGAASNGTATASGTGISKAIGYTPTAHWSGTDSFDVQITDGTNTDTITIAVNVAAINDAPNAVADTAGVLVDSSSNSIDVLANDSDVEGTGLTISAIDNPSTQSGTVTTDGSTVSYTPAASFSGDDTFTYTVSDGTDTSVTTVTVTVSNNQSPVITEGATITVNMDEDGSPTPFSLTLNATDAESDTITWSISGAATNGTAIASGTGASMGIGYTPNANFNGSDSFNVQVSDGTSTDTITVTVNVAAQGDAPVITEGASTTVDMDEDGSPTAFTLTLNASDADGDTINWSISSVASNGVASATGTGTSKVISYSPDADFNGSDSFDVQITDGTTPATITVTVNVAAINDAPVATNDAANATLSATTVINVLANDSDADSDNLAITAVTDGGKGTVTHNATTISYTNTSGVETDTDSFTYTVADGNGGQMTATVTVTLVAASAYTPVDADVAMADGIGMPDDESFTDSNYSSLVGNYYNYWTVSTSTGNATYDWNGTSFITSPADRNTVRLGAAGWASVPQGIANAVVTSTDASAFSVQTRDASGNVLTDLTLSGFGELDITGTPMESIYTEYDGWVAAVTGNSFSAGAKVYELTLTRNQSEYELWCGNAWSDAYSPDGVCETAWNNVAISYITTLDGLIDVQMWHSDSYDNGTFTCPGFTMGAFRGAIASGSGTVDIYCDTDLTTPVATQTWNLVNVNGVDIVITPVNDGSGEDRIYTLYNGYVRPGDHMAAGVAGTFPVYNKAAADQMAAVFNTGGSSSGSDLVGAWTPDASGAIATDLVVFFDNGQYLQWTDASTGATGCGGATGPEGEVGTYSFDGSQLTISSHLQNGIGGFDHATDPCSLPAAPLSVTVSGDTLTLDSVTLYRVVDATNPSVGAWVQGTDFVWGTTSTFITVFYKTGEFFTWCSTSTFDPSSDCTENNPSGVEGIEIGTYSWSANVLTIGSTYVRDDNPTWSGISSVVQAVGSNTIQAVINGDSISLPEVSLGLTRIAAKAGTVTINFSGTAADADVTLLAGVYELDVDCCDALGNNVRVYSMLSGNATATTDLQYRWDGAAFVTVPQSTDRVLNSTTGAQEDFSNGKLISAVSAAEASIVDIDGAQYGDYTVTFEAMDITDVEMAGVLPPEWQGALVNPAATFTGGKWLRASYTANADIYYVDIWDQGTSCNVATATTDNCFALEYTLDGGSNWLQAATLGDLQPTAIAQVGWNDATGLGLGVAFDGAGNTTFYTTDGTQVGTGTYSNTVFGTTTPVNVRKFDIPANLSDTYVEGESNLIFFEDTDVTMGGVVRRGGHDVPGAPNMSGQFMALDDQALGELLSNIDGSVVP